MRKARFYFALIKAFIRRDKKKISFGFVLLLLFAFLIRVLLPLGIPQALASYKEFMKPTFSEGVVGVPEYPNPVFDNTEIERDISKLVFRGLTKVLPDGSLQGDLAESFKKTADTEYIFYLRKDIFWQDGVPFTSDDVLYTIKLIQDPSYESPQGESFKEVAVEKIDDYSVKFKLREKFSPFPYATTIGIIPAHIQLKSYRPIGTGNFAVEKITKDKIVLSNSLLRLNFKYYPSFEDASLALKLGQIHSLGGFSPQEVEYYDNFGRIALHKKIMKFRQAVVFFNTKNDFLKIKEVRQALSFAVERNAISDLAGGGARRALNELPADSWVQNNKDRYPFSLKNARESMQHAGFKFEGGQWGKDSKSVTLTIVTVDDTELNSIANLLKDFWSTLGIKINLKVVDFDELKKNIIPKRNFDVLVNFQEIAPDPDQYVLWHTTQAQGGNITGVSSAKLDKLLEDSRQIDNKKLRSERYRLFTNLLLDEAPAIFLYYPNYVWFVSDKVQGIDLADFANPADRFNSFRSWRIKNDLLELIN